MIRVMAILIPVAMAAHLSAADEGVFNSNLRLDEVINLIKSDGGGWHALVIPKDSSLFKSNHPSIYKILSVSKTEITVVSNGPVETSFGKRKVEKRLPLHSITEVTRILAAEPSEAKPEPDKKPD